MTEGKWYPIFIYSEKNKGAHNTITHSKQIVITVALPIANVCEFNYIHSNYNDIHYWTNPKISLIRTGAGPKLFGLVRFHCTSCFIRLVTLPSAISARVQCSTERLVAKL